MVHTCDLSAWEVESGGFIQELKASPDYSDLRWAWNHTSTSKGASKHQTNQAKPLCTLWLQSGSCLCLFLEGHFYFFTMCGHLKF